jgi:multidrug transporter EmrE-like cation transporter
MLQVGEIGLDGLLTNILMFVGNVWLWTALICYAASFLLWMSVLSKVEVSFAYPFLSIGYVVAALGGYYFFGESLSLTRIAGILVICIGVVLISRS